SEHATPPHSLTFSADGRTLTSAGDDLCVWDWKTGKAIRREKQEWEVREERGSSYVNPVPAFARRLPSLSSAVQSRDGKTLATGHAGTTEPAQPGLVRVWDFGTGKETRRWAHPPSEKPVPFATTDSEQQTNALPVTVLAVSDDGTFVATRVAEG